MAVLGPKSGQVQVFLLEKSFGQCSCAAACSEVVWGKYHTRISFLFDRVYVDHIYFCKSLLHSSFSCILKLQYCTDQQVKRPAFISSCETLPVKLGLFESKTPHCSSAVVLLYCLLWFYFYGLKNTRGYYPRTLAHRGALLTLGCLCNQFLPLGA